MGVPLKIDGFCMFLLWKIPSKWDDLEADVSRAGDPQGRRPLHLARDGLGARMLLEAKAMVNEGSN